MAGTTIKELFNDCVCKTTGLPCRGCSFYCEHREDGRQVLRVHRMTDREFRLMQMLEEDKALSRVMQVEELLLKQIK